MPGISSEQAALRDSARALFDTGGQLDRVRKASADWPEVDRSVWRDACESGWLKLLLSEQDGGWGASAGDLVAILDGVADLLAPEPLAPGLVVVALLQACPTSAAGALLEEMLQGRSITLLASNEAFPLAGAPAYALAEAQWADHVVCPDWEDGVFRLRVVSREVLDKAWPMRRTIDGGGLRFFSIGNVESRELGCGAGAEQTFIRAQNLLRLFASASLVGNAQRAFEMTLDYLKTRRQFGAPIGAFQALQHRAASMHVNCMAARALINEAVLAVGSAHELQACAMAKAKASGVAVAVLKECVQMHGAIGFTDEYQLALYFRRAVTLASQYGTADLCRSLI